MRRIASVALVETLRRTARATPDSKSCSTRLDFTILCIFTVGRGRGSADAYGVRGAWERYRVERARFN